jgi:hypothetical protein
MLLLAGLGFGLLALLVLLTPGWLAPRGEIRPGAVAPTPTDTPQPPVSQILPIAVLTVAGGVPALPAPIPTDVAPWIPPPICGGSVYTPPLCTPGPVLPTPVPPVISPTPVPGFLQADETGSADFGIWNYGYGVIHSEAETWATVYYDTHSVQALQAYAAANRTLAGQLAQTPGGVRVDVTFRDYVAPESFQAWLRAHDFYNGWYGVRVVDPQGRRADIAVPFQYTGGLPDWLMQGQVAPVSVWTTYAPPPPTPIGGYDMPDVAPAQTVRGIYYVSGMVDVAQLAGIAADPLVFLADVTPNVVRADLLSKGVLVASPYLNWVVIRPASPFWAMEDLGLEHFR